MCVDVCGVLVLDHLCSLDLDGLGGGGPCFGCDGCCGGGDSGLTVPGVNA